MSLKTVIYALVVALAGAHPVWAQSLDFIIQDQNGDPLSDAVVFFETPDRQDTTPREMILDQTGEKFSPYVMAARRGDVLKFHNSDPVSHHIYSFSRAMPLNMVMHRDTVSGDLLLEHSGVIALGCNIHDHMAAFVVVGDTDIAVVSDRDGNARLPGSKTTEREVKVWHPRLLKRALVSVPVSGGQGTTQTITLRVQPELKPPQTPAMNERAY